MHALALARPADRDRHQRAEVHVIGIGASMEEERPVAAAHHREDHVVDAAAEHATDGLDVGEADGSVRVSAARPDRPLDGARGEAEEPAAEARETDQGVACRARPGARMPNVPQGPSNDAVAVLGQAAPRVEDEGQARRIALGLAGHRCRRLRRVGLRVEEHLLQRDAGDAVHHRMVDLGDRGPAAAREPLDDPELPERPPAIQALGHEPPHEVADRGVVPRRRQRRPVHVVVDVEVTVGDPDGTPELERREPHALAVAGDERQLLAHQAVDLRPARGRALEDAQARDRHRRALVLEMEELCIEDAETVHGSSS